MLYRLEEIIKSADLCGLGVTAVFVWHCLAQIACLYCFNIGASSLRNRCVILAIAVGEENDLFVKKFVVLIVQEMSTSWELEDMFLLVNL